MNSLKTPLATPSRRGFFLNSVALGTSLPLALSACGGSADDTTASGGSTTGCGKGTTPAVPQGPYYLGSPLNRSNIAEGKPGVPLIYNFTVLDNNCQPVSGAIVDIWQCDKDGIYSGFSAEGTAGQYWLRGFQTTNASGLCSFTAIFPGWYNGRLTHLHAKVSVNGVLKQTTNFFFPKSVESAVYQNALYSKGQNPTTVARDIELRGDQARFDALLMNVSASGAGYAAAYTVYLS